MTDSSDYNPTINDLWPDPEGMPAEVNAILAELGKGAAREVAEIKANPWHRSKPWWRVDKTGRGAVRQIQVNKLSGSAAGLWLFTPTLSDQGQPVIGLDWQTWLTDDHTVPAQDEVWQIPSDLPDDALVLELAQFVGRRTAKGVVRRLRGTS